MSRVQSLMTNDQYSKMPILKTKNKPTSSCAHPLCASCQLARPHLNISHLPSRQSTPEMRIRGNDLRPGDCFSVDHYICHEKDRLPDTAGKEKDTKRYSGGFIAVNHASAYVHVDHQVSLRAGETLQCKARLQTFANEYGVRIKKYRSDNGIFASIPWKRDCTLKRQRQKFFGVGAQHQNGVAERSIQTLSNWARSMMIHMALYWPDQADVSLWPFAMTHAAHVWNHMPKGDTNLAPIDLFTGSKLTSYNCLKQLHVWGCPVFVLHPSLQSGKKLPKWKPRAKLGQYLGVAPNFASTVGNILNVDSGFVSPQYHVVHDAFFQTVSALQANDWNSLGGVQAWKQLYEKGTERYVQPDDIPVRRQQQEQAPSFQRESTSSDSDSDSADEELVTETIEVINPETTPNEEMNEAPTSHSSPVPSPTPNSNARNGSRNSRRTRSGRQVRIPK